MNSVVTAEAVLLAFRSSGRRHLALTGGRGSGKSRLLSELCGLLQVENGLKSRRIPGDSVWLYDLKRRQAVQAGRFSAGLSGERGRMRVLREAFEDWGVRELARLASLPDAFVCLDELGYLEESCEHYWQALCGLAEEKQLIVSVRADDLPHLRAFLDRADVFAVDLDDPFAATGCIHLASGQSRRFGVNKLLADFAGRPLIEYALELGRDVMAERICVTRYPEIESLCRRLSVPVLLHGEAYLNDTVRLGLQALSDKLTGYLFLPSDQPLLSADTVRAMLLLAGQEPDCIIRPFAEGRAGAPVWFPEALRSELMQLPEGEGGSYVIRRHRERLRFLLIDRGEELADIDSTEDLERLLSLM